MKKNHKSILQELYNHPSLDRNNGLKFSIVKERFNYENLNETLKDLKKWWYIEDNYSWDSIDHSIWLTKEWQKLMIQNDFGRKIDRIKWGTIIAAVASSIWALYTILSYYFK